MGEIERRAVFRPEFHVLFIGTDQQPLAFLPQIIFAISIGDRGQAPIHLIDLVNGLGHEILVFGRLQRQFDSRQCSHFTAPEARRVDHPLGFDIALGGFDRPGAVRFLDRACDGVKRYISAPRWRAPTA